MLKDKNGKWVETLEIPEELWKKMKQETLNGVFKLLESAEILLKYGGNEAICAGLYTYAVEEYGKILLLKQYNPSDGKVKIKYKDEFRKHKAKFKIAFESLLEECKTLYKGAFSREHFNSQSFDVNQVADFQARLAIFYSDFTESGNDIVRVPDVDKDCLKKATHKFKTIAFGTTI